LIQSRKVGGADLIEHRAVLLFMRMDRGVPSYLRMSPIISENNAQKGPLSTIIYEILQKNPRFFYWLLEYQVGGKIKKRQGLWLDVPGKAVEG
jgi:hypothetical protein